MTRWAIIWGDDDVFSFNIPSPHIAYGVTYVYDGVLL